MSTKRRLHRSLCRIGDRVSRWQQGSLTKRVVLGVTILLVVVLTLIPLGFLVWTSVWSGFPGQFDAALTVDHFVQVYVKGDYDALRLLSNSVFVAIGMTTIAMSFGLLFAWLFVRTDLPTKSAMELVLVSPYAIPGYLYAMMYVTAYGAENGLVPTVLRDVFGPGSLPIDIYSPWGIVLVLGINSVTTCYLLIAPALQKVDPALEEVSRVHGASVIQTFRSVSIPLIYPALLSGILVMFLRGLGAFSIVAILGAEDGYDVYSTAIWRAIRQQAIPQYGAAAALACSLLLITLVLVWYYRKVTSRKEDFMTLTRQSRTPTRFDLGRWRWPVAAGLWAVLFLFWIIPVLSMMLTSVHSIWFGYLDFSSLTLEHYIRALSSPRLRDAFLNSAFVAVAGATIGTVLVVGMAYYTERTDGHLRGFVDFLSLTPLAVPGIIMGTSVLFTALWVGNLVPALNLYGSLWIIVIGSVVVYIPVSSRIAVGNIVQIHSHLEEAGRIFGASWLGQLREIFLPLFRNTAAIVWFYLLVHIFQLITVAIMTYTSDTRVIPVEMFRLYTHAELELVSALSTIIVGLTFLVLLVFRYIGVSFYEVGRS